MNKFAFLLACGLLTGSLFCLPVPAQQPDAPLTSQELVRLVYQLPKHPEQRDAVIEEIRRRGIGFELTEGMRGVVATKSGNDALLRRTLEEADRRRANPAGTAAMPAPAEAAQLLEQARKTTLAAASGLPDFVVKQLITRAEARGTTHNWTELDRLTVAVSYRERLGEQYKLLAINGLPAGGGPERDDYSQAGGANSTGEFAARLLALFQTEAQTQFRFAGTDTLRGHAAFIYDYEVAKKNARELITWHGDGDELTTHAGLRGKIWIDRAAARVLRAEFTTTEIEPGFPVKQVDRRLDYDWVEIAGQKYLLPVAAEIIGTKLVSITEFDPETREKRTHKELMQDRNLIRFRNYQKFGAEVKILEEDDFPVEEPPKRPE
jgi:hypothetical protein